MIPGYRTIRVTVPENCHLVGEKLKGSRTWDEFIELLIYRKDAELQKGKALIAAEEGGGK